MRKILHHVLRALRFAFVVLLIILPVPVANLFFSILRRDRRAIPTQTMKKQG